jgi:hypothetical protein
VAEGYLVPPVAVSVPLKFVRQGIRYDELSEEENVHGHRPSVEAAGMAAQGGSPSRPVPVGISLRGVIQDAQSCRRRG